MSLMKLSRNVSQARTSYSAVVTVGRMKSELQQAAAMVDNVGKLHAASAVLLASRNCDWHVTVEHHEHLSMAR